MRDINIQWILLVSILFCSSISAQSVNRTKYSTNSTILITGEDYITGEDGIPRITLNVWGHVKNPGAYLMYDGIDILTALAIAGGPLKGAKTKKIKIISRNGEVKIINLDAYMGMNDILAINFRPHDTIHVDETLGNYILSRGNLINVLTQVTNMLLIASNNK